MDCTVALVYVDASAFTLLIWIYCVGLVCWMALVVGVAMWGLAAGGYPLI